MKANLPKISCITAVMNSLNTQASLYKALAGSDGVDPTAQHKGHIGPMKFTAVNARSKLT